MLDSFLRSDPELPTSKQGSGTNVINNMIANTECLKTFCICDLIGVGGLGVGAAPPWGLAGHIPVPWYRGVAQQAETTVGHQFGLLLHPGNEPFASLS